MQCSCKIYTSCTFSVSENIFGVKKRCMTMVSLAQTTVHGLVSVRLAYPFSLSHQCRLPPIRLANCMSFCTATKYEKNRKEMRAN